MEDIELTNEENLGLNQSLGASVQFEIPVSASLKIADISRKVEQKVKDFRKVDYDLAKKYAKKEDGKIVYRENNEGQATQDPVIEDKEGYIKEKNELLDETIELHVPVFTEKDFNSILKLVGADENSEGGEEKELPPIVLKAWVTLMDESIDLGELLG